MSTRRADYLRPESVEEMLARADAETTCDVSVLIEVADRWIAKWSDLADREEAGEFLDGRASIYTGETYAQARDRWQEYRDRLAVRARTDLAGS